MLPFRPVSPLFAQLSQNRKTSGKMTVVTCVSVLSTTLVRNNPHSAVYVFVETCRLCNHADLCKSSFNAIFNPLAPEFYI